ncbi:hypothetical protein EMIT0P74_20012 [Pseudomonas sp. IT-P74]|uniref:hypothetical protein n=1 Tax=Pseudomonas sp. IT-P74 TaxID=3026445 RepID=UPI000FC27014
MANASQLRRKICGSELARDGGVSANGDVEADGLIASRLEWPCFFAGLIARLPLIAKA